MKNQDAPNALPNGQFERTIPAEHAIAIIRQIIELHGLKLRLYYAGTDPKTFHAFLTDDRIGKQFIGCGKGIGVQSEASALFEAFEHYMSFIQLHNQKKSIKLTVAENGAIDFLINEYLLPNNFVDLIGGAHRTLPWVKLASLHGTRTIHYPICLIDPKYNHDNKFSYDESHFNNLSYLSNSTGCASGSCLDESLIHALHEAIERDATSLFLYNGFIKKRPLRIVDKETIPDYLKNYIKWIENEFNDELFIIDITSRIKVPCFCVTFSQHNAPIPPKGFGASLSKAYALERALLESLQPVHLRNEHLNKVENNTVNRLKNYPLLQAAAVADVKQAIQEKRFYLTDFKEITDLYTHETLVEQKNKILLLLKERGHIAYYNELYKLEQYSLVQVLVTRFSNLYLLQTGKLILPNVNYLEDRLAA